MEHNDLRSITLAVIDPKPWGFEGLLQAVADCRSQVLFRATASEALRLARHRAVDLWLIQVALPDMSGFDLAEMLRAGISAGLAFLVADEYRAEDEIRALGLDRTSYFCKPLDASWLCQWYAVFRGKGAKPSTTLERA